MMKPNPAAVAVYQAWKRQWNKHVRAVKEHNRRLDELRAFDQAWLDFTTNHPNASLARVGRTLDNITEGGDELRALWAKYLETQPKP